MSITNGISFDSISSVLGKATNDSETSLRALIDKANTDTSPQAMIDLQVGLQKWSMLVQLQSTVIKDLGDALKGVIQKAS